MGARVHHLDKTCRHTSSIHCRKFGYKESRKKESETKKRIKELSRKKKEQNELGLRYCWSFICMWMWTLFKAIESVKMGLKRVKKKIGGEKIGPRLGKKIDRLEVYTSPVLKSLATLEVCRLLGVSRASSKESKRTFLVPDWS